MNKYDFHIHTNLSDGDHDINDVIKMAKENNCKSIAITDHEIIKDYSKISEKENIKIFNGIEFNTDTKGMHILGYGIKDIKEVNRYMNDIFQENEYVAYELVELLNKKGINITLDSLVEYLDLMNIKYDYLDKRHVVKYLIAKGITKDVYDTYQSLIGRGTDLYIPLKKITADDVISKVDECGGITVLAHPFTLTQDDKELDDKIKYLVDKGISGIEVINGNNYHELKSTYEQLSKKYKLLKTVGSDFHSITKSTIGIEYDEELSEQLEEKILKKHNGR